MVEQIKRIGQDPELADQVFAEAVRQQKLERQRFQKEYKRLQKERQQKGEEIKRLVGVITSSVQPSISLTERISEVELIVGNLDMRITELKISLKGLKGQDVKRIDIADALRDFTPIWDHLNNIERVRLLNLVLQEAVYQNQSATIELIFKSFTNTN